MDLADLFDALSVTHIEEFVAAKREEDLRLDFKTASRSDLSASDDRKNFAKALSGFANSSGGLVIWGVLAKRANPNAPDCATELRPVDDALLFVTRLNEYTGMFVRPLVDGVRHKTILRDGTTGFAVTLIPESDAGPHMALGGEGRYYKRSGASFYPMEHFDLEDMFGRRRRPHLEISMRVRPTGAIASGGATIRKNGQLVIAARNVGRGSARELYLSLHVAAPYRLAQYGLDGSGRETLVRLHGGDDPQTYKLAAPPHFVIHPGAEYDIAALDVSASIGSTPPDVQLSYEHAAEDLPLKKGSLRFPGQDLLDALLGRESRIVV